MLTKTCSSVHNFCTSQKALGFVNPPAPPAAHRGGKLARSIRTAMDNIELTIPSTSSWRGPLQKAYEILNKPLNLPNIKTNTSKSLNKENLVNFYNNEYQKHLQEGDLDKAFELSCKSDEVTNKKYNIIYPFVNKKGEPMKIWDN